MRIPDVIIGTEEVTQVRNRIFLRYVLSYALVLFLPIFLMYFYFDGAIIRRYSDEMTATDSSMLIQLRDTVDAQFQQLFNLAYVIQNTSSLNPKNIGTDIVARRNAIALLGTYNSIAELPESIIVYRSGDDVCYTGTTAIKPEKLFGQQMVYSGHSAEDFFDSVEELTGKLKTLIAGACSAVSDSGEEKTDKRSENLKQYVRDNCFQSDFSLQMAADHFGLTPSNLSHYFKNCTGVGLSEYVQEVRRTEACRLLSQTDTAIQEIGRQVGMVNVSSFIRFFKQQTGLTPGQYREKHAGHAGKN